MRIRDKEFAFQIPSAEVKRGRDIYPWTKVARENPGCSCVGIALYTVMENPRDVEQALSRRGTPRKTDPVVCRFLARAKPDRSFFVVMTMQLGSPPKVKVVRGKGLDSVVQAGGRLIRFDGEKVLIGDADAKPEDGQVALRGAVAAAAVR